MNLTPLEKYYLKSREREIDVLDYIIKNILPNYETEEPYCEEVAENLAYHIKGEFPDYPIYLSRGLCNGIGHVWLETADGYIIDPTVDQFFDIPDYYPDETRRI